jgi:hypothetical protein
VETMRTDRKACRHESQALFPKGELIRSFAPQPGFGFVGGRLEGGQRQRHRQRQRLQLSPVMAGGTKAASIDGELCKSAPKFRDTPSPAYRAVISQT